LKTMIEAEIFTALIFANLCEKRKSTRLRCFPLPN
jgi:hypothetical protein